MPRSTIDPVGSNARCGSEVLSVNELSTTNVDPAARCELAASAAAAQASAVSATSGTISRHLWKVERLNSTPCCSRVAFQTIGLPARPPVGERLRRLPRRLQPAGGAPLRGQLHQRRLLDRAAVERVGAARVEAAAGRRMRGVGHLAGQASRAGRPPRRRAARPRSAPRCTGCAGCSQSGIGRRRSRPSGRGTSPRRRRRRAGRSRGRARSAAAPRRARATRRFRRFASCACADASSDASGSSSTITDGSAASARAIAIRWRWPPENSCGKRLNAFAGRPTSSSSSRTRASRCSPPDRRRRPGCRSCGAG